MRPGVNLESVAWWQHVQAVGVPEGGQPAIPGIPAAAGTGVDAESRTGPNFDLFFERAGGRYQVAVARSPVGGGQSVSFDLPFSDLELENLVLKVGRSRARLRRAEHPLVSSAKDAGDRLFNAIFSGGVGECLRRSLDHADEEQAMLRIRLRLGECPELGNMPWELLYDRSEDRFLALSGRTPVIRYMQFPAARRKVIASAPLRILVIKSEPADYEPLELDAEWEKVSEALGELTGSGLVSFTELANPTLGSLRRALVRETFHIVHYMGHGGFDQRSGGFLVFTDQDGQSSPVTADDLGVMLYDYQDIRLVVLNACEAARTDATDPFAGVADSLVRRGVPAVVAMQWEITDRAAIEFAPALYGALAAGLPVDTAVAEARKAIRAISALEWATPVLYLRADDTRLFDVLHGTRTAEAAVTVVPEAAVAVTAEPAEAPAVPSASGRRQRTTAKPEASETSLRIGIAGCGGSGKSVLMAVLVRHFRGAVAGRFGADVGFAAAAPGGHPSQSVYRHVVENSLYADGNLPVRALPAAVGQARAEDKTVVLRWQQEVARALRAPVVRSALISFSEAASSDLADMDSVFQLHHIADCNALIITVDPFAIRGARDMARPPAAAVGESSYTEMLDVISRITEFLRTEHGTGGDQRVSVPVAVVVTKIDAFYAEFDSRSPILTVPRGVAAYDDKDGRSVHEEVRRLLQGWGAGGIDIHMRLNYSDYRYFAVSALGSTPDYENGLVAAGGIRSHRVEDPVLWLMSRHKVVSNV